VLVQLVVMSRSPWLERGVGRDLLAAAHRWVGFLAVSLLVAHAVLITLGYAATSSTGAGAELWKLLTTYPDVLMAAAGLAAFVAVGVTSLRAARRRLAYETWQFVHLYAYLAVALAFAHQLANGADFATGRAPSGLASITIIGPRLATADAYATATLARGPDGPRWAASLAEHGVFAVLADGRAVSNLDFARHRIT
jgi:DMSO/TMAO reductase YedYZ heme-binding membrane subunit